MKKGIQLKTVLESIIIISKKIEQEISIQDYKNSILILIIMEMVA
jgi:hypothetical protein